MISIAAPIQVPDYTRWNDVGEFKFVLPTRGMREKQKTIGDNVGHNETSDVQHPQAKFFENSRLMTKREVADYFRVSTRTIDRWSKGGKIRKIKIGGEVRFKSEEVAELLGNKEDTQCQACF